MNNQVVACSGNACSGNSNTMGGQPSFNQGGQTPNSPNLLADVLGSFGPLPGTSNLPINTGTPASFGGNNGIGNQQVGDNAGSADSQQARDNSGVGDQQAETPYTPGSTDDPNCQAGCYEPTVLNDLGISPQFSDGMPSTQTSSDNAPLTLEQLQAQVDQNTKIVAQQISDAGGLPTTPEETDYGSIFGASACGTERCYGVAFTIDSSGVNSFVTDPSNSTGTPQGSVYALTGRNPQAVAGGDSITASAGDYAVSVSATNGVPDGKGFASGVSFGVPLPSVSQTRGVPIGNIAPTSPPTGVAPGSYQIITDSQGNIWGQKPNGDRELIQRVSP